jgi:hypothetical protein
MTHRLHQQLEEPALKAVSRLRNGIDLDRFQYRHYPNTTTYSNTTTKVLGGFRRGISMALRC